jgi:hypothetical protein
MNTGQWPALASRRRLPGTTMQCMDWIGFMEGTGNDDLIIASRSS